MAKFSLRCELRSVVIRGVQRLREIEIAREISEFVLLESRMVVAAAHDDPTAGTAPTPLEIRRACEAIRASWSDEDIENRLNRTHVAAQRGFSEAQAKVHRQATDRVGNRLAKRRREMAGKRRTRRVAVMEGGAV